MVLVAILFGVYHLKESLWGHQSTRSGYIKGNRLFRMRESRHALQNAYSIGKTFHFLDKRRSSSIPGGTCISIRFWFHVLLEHKEQESRCICPGTPPGHVVYGNTLLRNALSNFIFRRLRRRRRTLNDNSTPSWHCRVVWTLLRFGNARDILIVVAAKLSLAICLSPVVK